MPPESLDLIQATAGANLVFKHMGSSISAISDKKKKAFVQEVSFMWRLHSSPFFAAVKGYCEEPMGILMKCNEWGDLPAFIEVKSQLDRLETYCKTSLFQICLDISKAIAYMHQSNLAHCDIKPGNVMIEYPRSGVLKALMTDFGISRILENQELGVEGLETIDLNGASLGYASPEAILRLKRISLDQRPHIIKSGDVFSLSATFFNMINCIPP